MTSQPWRQLFLLVSGGEIGKVVSLKLRSAGEVAMLPLTPTPICSLPNSQKRRTKLWSIDLILFSKTGNPHYLLPVNKHSADVYVFFGECSEIHGQLLPKLKGIRCSLWAKTARPLSVRWQANLKALPLNCLVTTSKSFQLSEPQCSRW